MRKTVCCLLLVLALGAVFLFAGEVQAGTTQNETGHVYNADLSSVPADGDIAFAAFIVGRESEFQTESSTGAGYKDGWWVVNVGNFPTAWAAGETLHIDFANLVNSQTGSVDIILLDYGHSTAAQEACESPYSDCLYPAIEYAPIDVYLTSNVCLVTLSVSGSPYGGIGSAGEKVTIAVNPSNRVADISFDLSFDASLLSIDSISLSAATQGWTISADSSVPGQISANMSNPTHTGLAPGNNVPVLDILVDVSASATPGSVSSLTFSNPSVTSDLQTTMKSCTRDASFFICRKGDADLSGTVDVADLLKILRMSILIDPSPATPDEWCRFELTGDGEVNILDAVQSLRMALGL